VLWTLRDTTTPVQQVEMLQGLAFLGMECLDVQAGDYGSDLFGGGAPLRAVRPSRRSPRWRLPAAPPANYDVALHLDFDSWEQHDAYGVDPVHNAASAFNESVSCDELTARVDWWWEGPSLNQRGHIRHVAMFLWGDDITDTARQRALEAVRRLEAAPGVEALTTGQNVGRLTTDFDWILDAQITDQDAARALLDSDVYAQAMRTVAAATKFEWTARVSHVIRGR